MKRNDVRSVSALYRIIMSMAVTSTADPASVASIQQKQSRCVFMRSCILVCWPPIMHLANALLIVWKIQSLGLESIAWPILRTMHMLSPCSYSSTRANSGKSNVAWVRRYSQCSREGESSPIRLTERETSRWEMIDSTKCCAICQTMKILNDTTQIYHLKSQAVLYLLGVKWCWNTQTNKTKHSGTNRRVKLCLSLLWKSQAPIFFPIFKWNHFSGVSGHVKMLRSPSLESHLPCHLNFSLKPSAIFEVWHFKSLPFLLE